MELGRFFGFLHPALVHFPLVLLLVSVGLETVGFLRRDARAAWAAQILLLLGVVAMLFAFVAGNFAEIWAARDGVPQEPMEQHELLATATSWLFVFLAAGRLFLGANAPRRAMALYLVLALGGCVLLGVTGHRGAMLVYQRGAGVQRSSVSAPPIHEDLAVLRQKQDPDALFYSDQMHHIFGGMVLILAGMLLLDTASPRIGARLRKLGPLLLLAGGLFLMIYSDTDSWPLSHQRPITDKEVLMHKTYALLMLIVGLRGLWRRRGAPPGRPLQSRAMAVFALLGGALLFTHVHSNAPYANVAVGVYLHHTVMGFLALAIGAVKLLEDTLTSRQALPAEAALSFPAVPLPPGESTAPAPSISSSAPSAPSHVPSIPAHTAARRLLRGLAWAYPCLMLTESIFLLNYNEGLPWFLGYRHLSLAAPHRGLIAPFGSHRAELCYDPNSTQLDLYLLDQRANRPAPLPADRVELLVRVGTEATVVPLDAVPEPGDHAHFRGTATFLRGVPLFQAQALLPGEGTSRENQRAGAALQLADFEPWIDKSIDESPSRAAYVCPMHPAVGAGGPGLCPVCAMRLVPNRPARAWDRLHDDAYHMELTLQSVGSRPLPLPQVASLHPVQIAQSGSDAAPPRTSDLVHLTFTPRRADGGIVSALDVVHTKKMHLILVRSDLAFYDHLHPVPQPDGTLTLDYRFPSPGNYILYADLTPTGDRNQVFRLPVTVEGTPPAPQPIAASPALAKVFGAYRVALTLSPDSPQSGDETQLQFTVYHNGLPVTDLEPFLGAGGHCVALSEDTRSYLHSHPVQNSRQDRQLPDGPRYGPSVTFHTLFPRPGLYKIWGQFQHRGHPLTADFVVRVDR